MRRFLESPEVRDAVDAVADARRLTVFAGAGTSAEAGLPLWERLVSDLTADVLQAANPTVDAEELLRRSDEMDVLARAELAQAMVLNQAPAGLGSLEDAIFERLYGEDAPEELVPGHLAMSIALLQQSFGDEMRIATTNYDVLLEAALAAVGYPRSRIRSYITGRAPGPGDVAVTHLHGELSSRRRRGVVLTEGDYHRMQRRTSWQENYSIEALGTSTCVFVGASMTDSNVLRYLHGTPGDTAKHYAFFVRGADEAPKPSAARLAWEAALRERWARLGVQALFPDHYADVAQFMREVWLRRAYGASYQGFAARQDTWLERSRDGVRTGDAGKYQTVQEELSSALGESLVRFTSAVASVVGDTIQAETLQLGLFTIYEPDTGSDQERAQVLVTSDRIMLDPRVVEPLLLSSASRWTGVVAMTRGTRHAQRKNIYASRWRYVHAVPVIDSDVGMLVGALALSTTAAPEDTVLRNLGGRQVGTIQGFLEDVGETLIRNEA